MRACIRTVRAGRVSVQACIRTVRAGRVCSATINLSGRRQLS